MNHDVAEFSDLDVTRECVGLAAGFLHGPEPAACREALFEALPVVLAAARNLGHPLAVSLGALAETLPPADEFGGFCEHLAEDHVALFVSRHGGVPAPPYASVYLEAEPRVMGEAAVAMGRLLEAAGLSEIAAGEPPDHAGVELEFVYHLLCREMAGDAARVAGDHLAPWLGTFAERVAAADSRGFYAALAALARDSVDMLRRAHS